MIRRMEELIFCNETSWSTKKVFESVDEDDLDIRVTFGCIQKIEENKEIKDFKESRHWIRVYFYSFKKIGSVGLLGCKKKLLSRFFS